MIPVRGGRTAYGRLDPAPRLRESSTDHRAPIIEHSVTARPTRREPRPVSDILDELQWRGSVALT
ncbi:MAG TPA: hypothetical protein PLX68_04370, partial [Dermatophilaceae bacterium]|nr:hypothetical protein [Dermatophilaceae bacterium]